MLCRGYVQVQWGRFVFVVIVVVVIVVVVSFCSFGGVFAHLISKVMVEVPTVKWSDIGGNEHVIQSLKVSQDGKKGKKDFI